MLYYRQIYKGKSRLGCSARTNTGLQTAVTQICQCAGLVGKAFMAFESIGWFGYFGFPESARPWQNQLLWDKSSSCSIDINQSWICGILYAIFGYQVITKSSKRNLNHSGMQPVSVPQNEFVLMLSV